MNNSCQHSNRRFHLILLQSIAIQFGYLSEKFCLRVPRVKLAACAGTLPKKAALAILCLSGIDPSRCKFISTLRLPESSYFLLRRQYSKAQVHFIQASCRPLIIIVIRCLGLWRRSDFQSNNSAVRSVFVRICYVTVYPQISPC